jgi:hypothetical protein
MHLQRTSKIWIFCVSLFGAFALSAPAHAQSANMTVVDGYVFDAGTLKPLANTYVLLHEVLDQATSRNVFIATDANGFYSVATQFSDSMPPSSILSHSLTATCSTNKGMVQNSIYLDSPLKIDFAYHRNFYLTLPKKATRCNAFAFVAPH